MKSALKRIMNIDMKRILNRDLNSNGIYIEFDETDILKAKALIIGPKDTLYDNAYLFFTIEFPKNYPFSPPTLTYKSQNKIRIHPNIYVSGKVCLSILGTWSGPSWTHTMDITIVLLTIQSLLDAANFIRVLEERQGLKIGCPEEVAFRQGFIDADQLRVLAMRLDKSGYGRYLLELLEGS